jgi:thioredoxin 1
MAEIKTLTQNTFADETENGLQLTDFWATWCTPCKIQSPILESLSKETDDVQINKIDVDENVELAKSLGIKSIPTLILKKDGKVVETIIGVHNKNQLNEIISKYK